MEKNKFLIKKKLLFSNIFKINDRIEELEEKDSSELFTDEDNNNKMNKTSNESEINESYQSNDNMSPKKITIQIYSGCKRYSVMYDINKTLQELIQYLRRKNYILGKKNLKILYGLSELKINDNRSFLEIISDNNNYLDIGKDNQLKIIIVENMEKEFIKNKKTEKIYVSLENIQNQKDIKYDIVYKNNCCNITFLSPEISFSFVTFMTNLKFTNKYYRKLIIKYKYNNVQIKKNHYLSQKSLFSNNNNINIINNNILNPNLSRNGNRMNLNNYNSYERKNYKNISCSYSHIYVKTEPNDINNINNYFNNKYESINNSTPYDQEKIINKLEKEKSKKKWITNKGFFNGVNKKSFNSFINSIIFN